MDSSLGVMFPQDGQGRLRFVHVGYFVVLGMYRDGIVVGTCK